ncbi:alpha/beta fold hydrolase [Streptomyces cyaneofuscatus]
MGGITALLTAAAHPELVRALVLVEAGPDGPSPSLPSSTDSAHRRGPSAQAKTRPPTAAGAAVVTPVYRDQRTSPDSRSRERRRPPPSGETKWTASWWITGAAVFGEVGADRVDPMDPEAAV